MSARPITSDTGPRLDAAAADVEDLRKQLQLALERRDKLIVTARTEGMSQISIARRAKVSQPHVVRLLAAGHAGLALP